jgi:DNA-binding LacI/PurR family transcriptional regulator
MAYEPALGIERLATVKEIAEAASVGVATVHRVLKGQPKVSLSTSRTVLEAIHRINERKISRARLGNRNWW